MSNSCLFSGGTLITCDMCVVYAQGDVAKGAPAKHPSEVFNIGITAFSEASVESPLVRR